MYISGSFAYIFREDGRTIALSNCGSCQLVNAVYTRAFSFMNRVKVTSLTIKTDAWIVIFLSCFMLIYIKYY